MVGSVVEYMAYMCGCGGLGLILSMGRKEGRVRNINKKKEKVDKERMDRRKEEQMEEKEV